MNQLYAILLGATIMLLNSGCFEQSNRCELKGHWTNREGQELIFDSLGRVIWLTHFGSRIDTLSALFKFNCTETPIQLDLNNIPGGPFAGKTLLGIVEWNNDSCFCFQYDLGDRPEAFDPDQVIKFYKK